MGRGDRYRDTPQDKAKDREHAGAGAGEARRILLCKELLQINKKRPKDSEVQWERPPPPASLPKASVLSIDVGGPEDSLAGETTAL